MQRTTESSDAHAATRTRVRSQRRRAALGPAHLASHETILHLDANVIVPDSVDYQRAADNSKHRGARLAQPLFLSPLDLRLATGIKLSGRARKLRERARAARQQASDLRGEAASSLAKAHSVCIVCKQIGCVFLT